MTQLAREYHELRRRNFAPYSIGHRLMYEVPLTLMKRNERATEKFSILEAGFGIGWGLDRMIDLGVVENYCGFEPDLESFEYVKGRRCGDRRLVLLNECFQRTEHSFDQVFCIEVIEHIPALDHLAFLTALRESTHGTLWLSTPDKVRCPEHGVRSSAEWRRLLKSAGFDAVTHHTQQWTDLYCCQ